MSKIRGLVAVAMVAAVTGLRTRFHQEALKGGPSQLASFYHTSDDIHTEIVRLEKSCSAPITVTSASCGPDCLIDIVDIGNPSHSRKMFYLFGEHARELISPETALVLIQDLCSPSPSRMVTEALTHSQFRIIPNGNPTARRLVEAGQFCLRANMNGVDLNRNWDAHWTADAAPNTALDQVNPGKFPFSEIETRIFREAVADFEPTVFATVHSGTLGMYMPWAYSTAADSSKIRNGRKMGEVLAELDSKFCQCPSGAAAREVGYNSPGTCLDWVHSHTKSEYSFAFEIYTGLGVEELRSRYLEQHNLRASSMLQLDSAMMKDNCFLQFNPESKDDFQRTVSNWSNGLVELAVITSKK